MIRNMTGKFELFFKISSVDIGICREESTGRQKDISDLYLWWKCELQINRADFGQEAFYGNRKIRMQGL